MSETKWVELAEESGMGQYVAPHNKYLMRFADMIRAEVIRECVAVCEADRAHWQACAPGANDGRYDWKADGAESCAEELRALLGGDDA